MVDYLGAIEADSRRFGRLIASTPMDAPVPSCPDWRMSDLAWHLAEVQHFWGHIVDGLLDDAAAVPELARPADDASLPGLFEEKSRFMCDALERGDPAAECWSWHDDRQTVGWVLRRQAHEALIHRVDAELAAGEPTPVDATLAADGVDEIIRYFLDSGTLPDWAVFEPDGSSAVIEIDVGAAAWALGLGRTRGTSPRTGNTYDLRAATLIGRPDEPTAVLRGAAVDMDLWLWGRGPAGPITVVGDGAMVDRIRATASDSTQ